MNVRFLTLDRVRVSAVLMVFVFHTVRYFDTMPWHVKSDSTSLAATGWTVFWSLCLMPVLFGISGAALRLALEEKAAAAVVLDKTKRILLPFILGIFLLAVPQVYVEAVTQRGFQGSLLDFIPEAFKGFYGFGGNFPWMGLHLWYLGVLFIFSLMCLPLLRFFKKTGLYEQLQELTDNSLLLFTPVIDMWIIDTVFNPNGILGRRDFGGWNLFVYLVIFLYGALYLGDREIVSKIRDCRFRSLFTGLLAGLAVLWLLYQGQPDYGFNRQTLILNGLRATAGWCLTLAWVGWLHQPFVRLDRWIRRLNPWVLPVYMLHQTVIVVIGWQMIGWALPVAVALPVLLLLSALTVWLLCKAYYLTSIPKGRKRSASPERKQIL